MVKQLRATLKEQAENLGFTNFPMYTFYGQPQGLKQETWKVKPKFVNSVSEWMKSSDPSVEESSPGQSLRTIFFYLLAPQLGVFVKVADLVAGYNAKKAKNHVYKMDIYTENENFVRDIVRIINDQFQDGILPNLNFEKLEKKFNVGRDDITNTWKRFLQ